MVKKQTLKQHLKKVIYKRKKVKNCKLLMQQDNDKSKGDTL